MIKICYIIGYLGRGGAEKQLYELVKGLDREKYIPTVISLSQGGYWCKEIERLDIKVIELMWRKNKDLIKSLNVIKLLKALKPHIVHTYLFSANFYGRIAASLARVPIIIASERNSVEIGEEKNRYHILADKLLAHFSDGIICNSRVASESLVKNYSFNSKKVFTVNNGIDCQSFLKEARSDIKKNARKLVGTVGRLDPQKNQRLFLDVAKIALESDKNRNLEFLLVGDGELRDELVKYSQQLGIDERVIFAGERTDTSSILHSMDILLMTSLYEGMSNALMEAMLAGLPIVATAVGGNSELIIDAETGFLCPLGDAKGLSEKVIYLLDNEDEARRMGEAGRKRIINEFGIEKMIKKTENIYLEFLDQKNILKHHRNYAHIANKDRKVFHEVCKFS